MNKKLLLLIPAITIAMSPHAMAERVVVGNFSTGDLNGWEPKFFKGETHYTLTDNRGNKVLKAESNNSASGMVRTIKIDLKQTPVLHWSWKTDGVFEAVDERTKKGDDYPARVYVVFSGGLFFWKTRAINYVWSSNQRVGSQWANAYTANARMVAVESGSTKIGKWINERRNVLADFRHLFHEEPDSVDAIAIMTDTDNSGKTSTSWYGDIWFSSE